jgi:hypothetical protein
LPADDTESIKVLCTKIDIELVEIARREKSSLLRNRGFDGLSTTSFEEINNKMQTSCPLFHKLLSAMLESDINNNEKKLAAIALIYSVIMFRRFHEMSRLQRVNTILLVEGGASQQVLF